MKILVMDDSQDKRRQICDVLTNMCGLIQTEIDQVDDLNKGRKLLFCHQYDLLVLDLVLPTNIGEDIIPDRGAHFIEEFDRYARLNKPLVIIGLTAYEDQFESMKQLYEDKLWALIQYRQESTDWQVTLQRAVQKAFDLRTAIMKSIQGTDRFDVAVICARVCEFIQLEQAFDHQWRDMETNSTIGLTFKWMEVLNRRAEKIRLVACCCGQTGMTATSAAATYLYTHYGVREIYMIGHCIGFPSRTSKGDLFIATSEYDYLHARLAEENGLIASVQDLYSISCSNELRTQIDAFIHEHTPQTTIAAAMRNAHLDDSDFTIRIGSGACGPEMVAKEPLLVEALLKRMPDLCAVDTEGYGLYATQHMVGGECSCLLIKGVAESVITGETTQTADACTYKSALFLREFLKMKYRIEK